MTETQNETSTADSGGSAAVPGSLPVKCPNCGAERLAPYQRYTSAPTRYACGAWWGDGPFHVPVLNDHADCAHRQIASLRQQLAAADADKERLDTMTVNHWSVDFNSRGMCWTVQKAGQVVGNIGTGCSPRAAIDAAMKAENDQAHGAAGGEKPTQTP
jgi:hypothetical protein